MTAGITAYYMFRLLFVTFLGEYRGEVAPADLGIAGEAPTGPPPEKKSRTTRTRRPGS